MSNILSIFNSKKRKNEINDDEYITKFKHLKLNSEKNTEPEIQSKIKNIMKILQVIVNQNTIMKSFDNK